MAQGKQVTFTWKCVLENGENVQLVQSEVKRSLPAGHSLGIFIDGSGNYKCTLVPDNSSDKEQTSALPLGSALLPEATGITQELDNFNMNPSGVLREIQEFGSQNTVEMESLPNSLPLADLNGLPPDSSRFSCVENSWVNVVNHVELPKIHDVRSSAKSCIGPIKNRRSLDSKRKSSCARSTIKSKRGRNSF